MRVAFFQLGLSHPNKRGPDYFFPFIFRELSGYEGVRAYYFTDKASVEYLRGESAPEQRESVVGLRQVNRNEPVKKAFQNLDFLWKLVKNRIDVIHVVTYGWHTDHYDRFKALRVLPSFIRPKLVLNIHHSGFPYEYLATHPDYYPHLSEKYGKVFSEIFLSGIFTWYHSFKSFALEHVAFKNKSILIHSINHYCCSGVFRPSTKEKTIVFASALEKIKRPLMFVDAIASVLHNRPDLLKGWKVLICGTGSQEGLVRARITDLGLAGVIDCRGYSDMKKIFPHTMCYVSTQDYENFTSLSMHEAMACGNVVVARNVGQTDYYVRNGENGYLAEEDNADGIAAAIIRFLEFPERHESMMAESIRIATEKHSVKNFLEELVEFWRTILKTPLKWFR